MLRLLVLGLVLIPAVPAFAQPAADTPAAAVDLVGGYAGMLDEALIGHSVVSATFRHHLTRKVSIGPEVVYMAGPGNDRDVFVTANLMWDFLAGARPPRTGVVSPYLVIGGGISRYMNDIGGRSFSSAEGAVTAGGGARVWLSERVYAMGEYRVGWEPHVRVTGGIGLAW